MKLIINFGPDCDTVDVPEIVIEKLRDYDIQFQKWLCDKSIDHDYWVYDEEGEKVGCQFRSEAFVEWLNVYPLKNSPEKAKVISRYIPMLRY